MFGLVKSHAIHVQLNHLQVVENALASFQKLQASLVAEQAARAAGNVSGNFVLASQTDAQLAAELVDCEAHIADLQKQDAAIHSAIVALRGA